MDDSKQKAKPKAEKQTEANAPAIRANDKPVWEKPVAEDVSEQVMAQPYIRFT